MVEPFGAAEVLIVTFVGFAFGLRTVMYWYGAVVVYVLAEAVAQAPDIDGIVCVDLRIMYVLLTCPGVGATRTMVGGAEQLSE